MGSEIGSTEESKSRDGVASALRAIADQFADEPSLELRAEGETVSVELAEPIAYELELERDGDEVELEIELEWRAPDSATETDDGDASGESTGTELDAEEAPSAAESDVEEEPSTAESVAAAESLGRFELFEDRAGEWRWRLVHRNGNVIATSGEGYTRKHNAEKGLRSVLATAPGAEIVAVDE
ncbi:amphi-Trp domain-containing protein [Halovivax sp.]|uniref:amphi-Trp domain-containing protein n=1 Tax=Halovivax sp. TaxID=1935978 RepID=UPI0025BC3274|nr:amphi-Trp domain-containing protein [Halovivax sp.]